MGQGVVVAIRVTQAVGCMSAKRTPTVSGAAMGDGEQPSSERCAGIEAVAAAYHRDPYFLKHFFGLAIAAGKPQYIAMQLFSIALIEHPKGVLVALLIVLHARFITQACVRKTRGCSECFVQPGKRCLQGRSALGHIDLARFPRYECR